MMNVREWWADYKAAKKKAHVNVVHSQFQVDERGGHLWLTHNGVAFLKINTDERAQFVTDMLNGARNCAVEYEGL